MKLLLRSVKILSPRSPFHGKTQDILIEGGIITAIEKSIAAPRGTVIHEGKGQQVSTGWMDLHARFCDPGFEHKEDLNTGLDAALQGGFTGVAVMPSTAPFMHTKSLVEYVIRKAEGKSVDVYPVGAITQNGAGKELAEMYDMQSSGAVAFSDDKHPIADAGLMLRALLYSKNFDGLIMHYPDDRSISGKGNMNEGVSSTRLGLAGIPAIAEELTIARDLKLAAYANSPIHFSTISTAGAVQLIRDAKKKGLKVSCDVAAHNLLFSDKDLDTFDSNLKLMPPLREAKDIKALIDGLCDGTIDAVCSDHTPEDVENKKKEFDYAHFGMIALETCFAVANTAFSKSTKSDKDAILESLIGALTDKPRSILSLALPDIKVGAKANLTIFDPNKEWLVAKNQLRSKSANSPLVDKKLTGKVIGVCHKDQWHLAR